jgi:hypothetical protein
MSKNIGRTYIDRDSYVNLGSPTTTQEWKDALILPAGYEVLNVRHETKEYVVMLASERIPVSATPVRITLIVTCEQKDEHHATLFIDHIAFSNANGPISVDKYDRYSVPHKHVKLAVSTATLGAELSRLAGAQTTPGTSVAPYMVTSGYKTAPLPTDETPTRDTQFRGWANQLLGDMLASTAFHHVDIDRFWDDDDYATIRELFARHAYDLAQHIASDWNEHCTDSSFTMRVEGVPDLVGSPGKIYSEDGVWIADE